MKINDWNKNQTLYSFPCEQSVYVCRAYIDTHLYGYVKGGDGIRSEKPRLRYSFRMIIIKSKQEKIYICM